MIERMFKERRLQNDYIETCNYLLSKDETSIGSPAKMCYRHETTRAVRERKGDVLIGYKLSQVTKSRYKRRAAPREVSFIMRVIIAVLLACLCASVALAGEGQGLGPGVQQWDFLELRDGAHMFYWLYNTLADVAAPEQRPLVVWLQGGPGASSTGYGNFEELGVLDLNLNVRESTWVNEVNVVFVDNPVGTGFSYVEKTSLIPRTNLEIATDLVTFTKLFLEKNPSFVDTPFYIFSESYGGKMAAEYALELQKAVERGDFKVNFKGVALGDGWVSPIDSVLTWAPFLLETGVVDYEGYESIRVSAEATRRAVEAGQWTLATSLWGATEGVIMRVTDSVDFYNILYKVRATNTRLQRTSNLGLDIYRRHLGRAEVSLYALMNGPVKEALGLPAERVWDSQSGSVWNALTGDFMKPATDVVERLLNETSIDVVVFTGQLDLIVDTPGTLDWVQRLKWSGAAGWRSAKRRSLSVAGMVEGYTKSYGSLIFYWIIRAGHMVPTDNPEAGLTMLRRVTQLE